jgi:hypothetical protein
MDYSLQVITEKHSEAARELFEHLDCKGDQRGLAKLDELLEYTTMLVQFLNDWKREHNGNHTGTTRLQHSYPSSERS